MTAAFWYVYGVALVSGALLGWAAHEWKTWWEARQFCRAVMRRIEEEEAQARARRRAMACGLWHIEAESDADALALFLRRAQLGVEGRR